MCVDEARRAGHAVILLVGDLSYYGPLGFEQLDAGAVTLPGPAHPNRILAASLTSGALDGLAGAARAISVPRETR
jgi:predicted N-acetyltransferase YhbS